MGKYETTMSGAAITSTLTQMSMIGDIGKEILREFGIKKIDIKREYSFKIRGSIHSETRKRFGKESLYFYGLTMMDGYKKIREEKGYLNADNFYNNNLSNINNKNILTARKYRNTFFKLFIKELGDMTKATIFTPIDNMVGASMKFLTKDKIEFSLTNAVLLENEIFNRGMIVDMLTVLGGRWNFNIKFIKSKSKQDHRGWCKFTWTIEFISNKEKEDPMVQIGQRTRGREGTSIFKQHEEQTKEAEAIRVQDNLYRRDGLYAQDRER